MRPNQFKSLVKFGYLNLYLIAKMVLKNNEPHLFVEVRIATTSSKIEAEAWQEMLLEYPLKDGWKGHNIVVSIVDLNQLTSCLDENKLYAITMTYRRNSLWNNHLHWLQTSNINEIQDFIDHWADNNDIFPDNEIFSVVVYPIITRDELFSNIEGWKPLLNLLSIEDRPHKQNKQLSLEEDLADNDFLIM